jgi:hypothetical protein
VGKGVRVRVIKSISDVEPRRVRGRPKNAESSRVHLSLPETLLDRLHEIQRDTHASSLTEVVKNALQLYAAAVEVHKNGGTVCFKDDKGGERQLAIFL